jgi:hypothetical protein
MTRQEYIEALDFASAIDVGNGMAGAFMCTPRFSFDRLPRGGIIGSVNLVDCVRRDETDSPWFQGAYGFVLRDPKAFSAEDFVPYKGQLGFFDVPGVLP